MELTATNRSQAYPISEGLKKFKKNLQKSDDCNIMLYVVLKVCESIASVHSTKLNIPP